MSDKPSAAWYLAPIFLGIIGSGIMWYVLKDEDHPDSPKMVRKGWVIGIILTLIMFAWWIPFMMMPFAFMGFDHQIEQTEQKTQRQIGQQIMQRLGKQAPEQAPAPGFEDADGIHSFEECVAAGNPAMESYPRQCRTADGKHFVEIIPGKEQCEIAGGLWGIWGNQVPVIVLCNPSTSDAGKECTDSSQCQSFCQAKEGAQIGIEDTGMCYGYELAICLQEVRNGVVEPEWCQ